MPDHTSTAAGSRLPRLLGTAAATAAVLVAGALPAAADNVTNPPDVNVGTYSSGDPLNLGLTVLYFIGIPLAVFALVGLFTVGIQKGVGALKYRPGRAWAFGTEWFGHSDIADDAAPLLTPGGSSGSW